LLILSIIFIADPVQYLVANAVLLPIASVARQKLSRYYGEKIFLRPEFSFYYDEKIPVQKRLDKMKGNRWKKAEN
jgi:hypothetical protein